MDGSYAWHDGNSGNQTQLVKRKLPNHWGLYDMFGNIYEWCEDRYDEEYYKKSATENPVNLSKGDHSVLRGGAWDSSTVCLRISCRNSDEPNNSFPIFEGGGSYGFRLVMTVEF